MSIVLQELKKLKAKYLKLQKENRELKRNFKSYQHKVCVMCTYKQPKTISEELDNEYYNE